MKLLTIKEVAAKAELADHQARYVIHRHQIPESRIVAGARMYHPWTVDFIRETRRDEHVIEERAKVRAQKLRAAIERATEDEAETVPADFGIERITA